MRLVINHLIISLKKGLRTCFSMEVAIILVWGGVSDFKKCFQEDLIPFYWFWNSVLFFINVEAPKTTLCSQIRQKKNGSKYLKNGHRTYFSMKVAIILVWGGVRDFNKLFQRDLMSFPNFETVCCFLSTLKQRKQHFVVRFGPKWAQNTLKRAIKRIFPWKLPLYWFGVVLGTSQKVFREI